MSDVIHFSTGLRRTMLVTACDARDRCAPINMLVRVSKVAAYRTKPCFPIFLSEAIDPGTVGQIVWVSSGVR